MHIAEVTHFVAPASLVVAHNAAFDRKFLERFCETFNTKAWACVPGLQLPAAFHLRLAQMAREGVRHTAQAFQQMGPARRYAGLVATLREQEATLTDAALNMFRSLVGRANLRARKRLEDTVAASAEGCQDRWFAETRTKTIAPTWAAAPGEVLGGSSPPSP
jgi:hypothetical protein